MTDDQPIGFEPSDPSPPRPFWPWLLGMVLLGALAAAILLPNFMPHHGCGGQLTFCKSNCKNLATALEMYASDNGGRYPHHLGKLLHGNYLKVIPTCPAAGEDTYSPTYQVSARPDMFSFCCRGNNHAKAYSGFTSDPHNYPQYSAKEGLIDHPPI